jgi:hypothetical protein
MSIMANEANVKMGRLLACGAAMFAVDFATRAIAVEPYG